MIRLMNENVNCVDLLHGFFMGFYSELKELKLILLFSKMALAIMRPSHKKALLDLRIPQRMRRF